MFFTCSYVNIWYQLLFIALWNNALIMITKQHIDQNKRLRYHKFVASGLNAIIDICTYLIKRGNICLVKRRYLKQCCLDSFPSGQIGRHIPNDTFRCIFVNERFSMLINIILKFVPMGAIDNNPALGQIMASKSKSKRVYLQSALGHINASGRGKAVLRRPQAVFKCLQWWGIDSFLAEGIPVKHSTSKKWILGSVMTRPGSSNCFYRGRAAWAYRDEEQSGCQGWLQNHVWSCMSSPASPFSSALSDQTSPAAQAWP